MRCAPVKTCNKCGEAKALHQYHANPKTRDGKQHTCKQCTADRQRTHYRANKELYAEKQRGYRKRNHEAVKANARRYYSDNVEVLKAKKKAAYHQNPGKFIKQTRAAHLRERFGITPDQFEEMNKAQGGACAICGSTKSGRKDKRLMIDHCHATGKVRALLCHHCNAGIGYFKDDISKLEAAIAYLRRHKPALSV